jgi:hypothetical protein
MNGGHISVSLILGISEGTPKVLRSGPEAETGLHSAEAAA